MRLSLLVTGLIQGSAWVSVARRWDMRLSLLVTGLIQGSAWVSVARRWDMRLSLSRILSEVRLLRAVTHCFSSQTLCLYEKAGFLRKMGYKTLMRCNHPKGRMSRTSALRTSADIQGERKLSP